MADKKGILRKEKLVIGGKEIEVDTFDAKVTLGSGKELESIEELLIEEEIEKTIQYMLKEINALTIKYPEKVKDIGYCYEVGKVLQLVDSKGFTDRRGLIWHRMAYDLYPDLFGGAKKNPTEAKRYPETMYLLGKQDQNVIKNATFNQWYEILKFKDIYKDKYLLEQIFKVCAQGITSVQLRQKIKEFKKRN